MDYSRDPASTRPNAHDYQMLDTMYAHLDSYNSYATGAPTGGGKGNGKGPNKGSTSMAGQNPMGMRIHKGVFHEVWAKEDGAGGMWVHHVTLAPGFEHTELLD